MSLAEYECIDISKFKSLKTIHFSDLHIGDDSNECYAKILSQIETVLLCDDIYFYDFYNEFLKFGKNLKKLFVTDDSSGRIFKRTKSRK